MTDQRKDMIKLFFWPTLLLFVAIAALAEYYFVGYVVPWLKE